jgi:hypothetical protein
MRIVLIAWPASLSDTLGGANENVAVLSSVLVQPPSGTVYVTFGTKLDVEYVPEWSLPRHAPPSGFGHTGGGAIADDDAADRTDALPVPAWADPPPHPAATPNSDAITTTDTAHGVERCFLEERLETTEAGLPWRSSIVGLLVRWARGLVTGRLVP